ncbi:putative glycosyl hydrolases family 16 protein 1 [Elsinoe fawcettii]|nr:putative glycosyl hydrolases family 16 protein 1 [Elsinoe fawcettii]
MLYSVTLLSALFATALAQSYRLTDTYTPANFFSKFDFFTAPDPTHGFVTYVDYNTAVSSKLIPTPSVANWGVDQNTVLSPTGAGRPSIRLTSKTRYNHGLFIADIQHMPDSTCGSWPAFWMLGQTGTWPQSGELDILEGVNRQTTNLISAHTKNGCTISGAGQTAVLQTNNCAVPFSTTGCSNSDPRTTSYGTGFNSQGGGVYAIDWTSSAIRVWFFPRSAIPRSILDNAPNPAADFGTPTANFAGSCNIDQQFYDMAIVFDTTFCGDWAGATYQGAGCPMTSGQGSQASCNSYVAKNPGAFSQQYWYVNYIKTYAQSAAARVQQDLSPEESVAPRMDANVTGLPLAMGRADGPAKRALRWEH